MLNTIAIDDISKNQWFSKQKYQEKVFHIVRNNSEMNYLKYISNCLEPWQEML